MIAIHLLLKEFLLFFHEDYVVNYTIETINKRLHKDKALSKAWTHTYIRDVYMVPLPYSLQPFDYPLLLDLRERIELIVLSFWKIKHNLYFYAVCSILNYLKNIYFYTIFNWSYFWHKCLMWNLTNIQQSSFWDLYFLMQILRNNYLFQFGYIICNYEHFSVKDQQTLLSILIGNCIFLFTVQADFILHLDQNLS